MFYSHHGVSSSFLLFCTTSFFSDSERSGSHLYFLDRCLFRKQDPLSTAASAQQLPFPLWVCLLFQDPHWVLRGALTSCHLDAFLIPPGLGRSCWATICGHALLVHLWVTRFPRHQCGCFHPHCQTDDRDFQGTNYILQFGEIPLIFKCLKYWGFFVLSFNVSYSSDVRLLGLSSKCVILFIGVP